MTRLIALQRLKAGHQRSATSLFARASLSADGTAGVGHRRQSMDDDENHGVLKVWEEVSKLSGLREGQADFVFWD